MARYLRCRVTRQTIGPAWLNDRDAEIAAGSSELLEVTYDWTMGRVTFPHKRGFNTAPMVELGWEHRAADQVERLVAMFHAAGEVHTRRLGNRDPERF